MDCFMKQHITIAQYNALSSEAKKILIAWYKNNLNKHYGGYEEEETKQMIIYNYPLLSVGQMIEFLMDHTPPRKLGVRELSWLDDTELCDGLWEQVKEVLERLKTMV